MMQHCAQLLPLALLLISCGTAFACHGKLIASGISTEERSIILQEHNRLRQLVATGRYPGQPGAENMREIVWDDELAARAQQWADNCQFRHDPHRTINRFTMGQNLAVIWSTAPLEAEDGDFPSRIQNWFNEVQKYSFGDAWSPKTGHYSQLVWGETSLVGCGFAEYKDNIKFNKLYVCNYGPGGNVVGYNPYEVGKPSCATYGMKPSARYQGLCAAPGASPVSTNSVYGGNTIETQHRRRRPVAAPLAQRHVAAVRPLPRRIISSTPAGISTSSRRIGPALRSLRSPYRSIPYYAPL
ncbi:venom allergen 5 isoform X2 [Drosophila virilis]|uniref:venom allergen 5 isoform X2 n=1 Tax=Drosophila virilis TaxID=7244 RepID=UPI0038B3237F